MPADLREVSLTVTAQGVSLLIDAIAQGISHHAWEKADRERIEQIEQYLKLRLASLPELPTQKKLPV